MNKAKIKNLILIMLALVNVFLLGIVLDNAYERQRAANYRKQALEQVLTDNGIKMNSDLELPEKIPPQVTLRRNLASEKKLIAGLIGDCAAQDLGGNIIYYEGTQGQARLRGTGEFEILPDSGVVSMKKDPVAPSIAAMKKLGIDCLEDTTVITGDSSGTTVVLGYAWNGVAVYNSKISLTFNSETLFLVSGSRPLDEKVAAVSTANYPDSTTVIMNFLESIRQTGEVCSEIKSLSIGYFLSSTVSGDCTLKPVWRIQTDAKAYYIDAETGAPESAEAAQ